MTASQPKRHRYSDAARARFGGWVEFFEAEPDPFDLLPELATARAALSRALSKAVAERAQDAEANHGSN